MKILIVRLLAMVLGTSFSLGQEKLEKFRDCKLVPTDWADGDSFQVLPAEGEAFTIRLYGVDCLETNVNTETDARRLRAQRRYFGITKYGGNPAESTRLAKRIGEAATAEVSRILSRPFTVFTSNQDGRGDPKFERVYGFVVTDDGRDLGEHLVAVGLARAFGVSRKTYDGRSREEYQEALGDLELTAAKRGRGAWEHTDWEALANERREQREEDREFDVAKGDDKIDDGERVFVNTASRDELMRLPGIGEKLANRIIEKRPHRKPESLLRVDGIGEGTLAKILPYLDFQGP